MSALPVSTHPLSLREAARAVGQRLQLDRPGRDLTITTPYVTTTEFLRMLRQHGLVPSTSTARRLMGYPVQLLPPTIAKLFAHDAPTPWQHILQRAQGGSRGLTYLIPLPYLSEIGRTIAQHSGYARSYRDRLTVRYRYVLSALVCDPHVSYAAIREQLPQGMTLPRRTFFHIKHILLQQERTFRWKS